MQRNTPYRDMWYNETVDEDREAAIRLKNKRNGMTVFQASWILVFVCLIVVNLQLRGGAPAWPPEGVERLDPVLPTLATLGLLASAVLVRRGMRTLLRDSLGGFLLQWRAALGLGALFVAVMAYEWLSVAPIPEMRVVLANGEEIITAITQYNAIFRVMTAFHAFHALVIGIYMVRVLRTAARGGLTEDTWSAEAGAKLWYFVVIAWLMFYVVLYWL
ncbi:MAG: cytochrome c oxidase subunit 3 [Chloroflexi bacterium]|nr:cytochrome c oxidase subunit 3 [Chloroflexota bacterium]